MMKKATIKHVMKSLVVPDNLFHEKTPLTFDHPKWAEGRTPLGTITEKHRARCAVSYSVKTERIIPPAVCESCSRTSLDLNAHHTDYSRPMDVIWLCHSCHGQAHCANQNHRKDVISASSGIKKTITHDASVREYGRALICFALSMSDGNKVKAAERLDLDLRRLLELIDELGISRKDY